ncbi:hypothetical protein JHL21_13290 [Devosia sp. WQ 349]|nr:hypothetical protein [Devosia sp. WQ 349K1]
MSRTPFALVPKNQILVFHQESEMPTDRSIEVAVAVGHPLVASEKNQ